MKTVLMIVLLFMVAAMSGCEEAQQTPKVWGKGELPAEHQDFFGNDNPSRLSYVQNQVLNRHSAVIRELAIRVLALEAVDPNAMRLEALELGMEKLTSVEPVG